VSTEALLTRPHVGRMLAASLLGRLPVGMMPLALVLFVRDDGRSYDVAGAVTAAYALGACVGGPTISRWMDAAGQRLPLVASGVVSAIAIALLPVAPWALVLPLTVVAGFAAPPLEPALRAVWPSLVRPAQLPSAYSIDAAAQELIFVVGPLIVLAASSIARTGGLVAAAVVTMLGVAWFVTGRPSREWVAAQQVSRHWLGPLRSRRLVVLYLAVIALGLTVGTLPVAFVGYGESVDQRSLGSWLVALNALGALAGGVTYSRLRRHPAPERAVGVLLLALAITYLPLALVPAPAAMAGLAVVSGVFLPAVLTCAFQLTDRWAPVGTTTEAFAWIISAFLVGSSIGAAATGAFLDAGRLGAPYVVGTAATVAAAACATLAARRHSH
jgi:predicted MFS family arabinose efflux permease